MEKCKDSLDDIYTYLKQWSFESKMKWAYQKSVSIMNPFQYKASDLPHDILEAFVMLSVKGLEYNCKEMTYSDFHMTINNIGSFRHPEFEKLSIEERTKWIFMTVVSNQLVHQMDPYHLLYRYMFYFSYNKEINMSEVFTEKYGVQYLDVIGPISLLWFSLIPNSGINMTPKGYKWMCKKYEKTFELLTISRKLYNKQLEQITSNIDDYRYCLRPSFLTPFVYYSGKRYLPTPHLLIKSATTSLMYRLTEGNNDIREKIGKYVLETYLYKIIKDNSEFDEVIQEKTYGNNQKTLDVLSSIDEDIICFDSKSFSPSIGIKMFSNIAYEHIKRVLADDICQAYKHIHDKYGIEYSFLSVPVKEDRSNIFAVIVIAEEPYLIREETYSIAANKLGIHIPSSEYDWLRGHVGITELSVLEKQLFSKNGIMDAIKRNSITGNYSDFWFFDGKVNENDDANIERILDDLWTPINEEAMKDNIPLIIGEIKNGLL